jgi:hypothetical protein
MAYFHSMYIRSRGGPGRKDRIKVIGETIEEQKDLKRRFPDATTINWPSTREGKYKSRSLPEVWLNADRQDILAEIESCEVPEPYIPVLTMMMRELFWKRTRHWDEEMEKYFELEIRGKTIGLITSGLVIKDTENLNLQNLHRRLEKIDLGRRTDLNLLEGIDTANRKYDQDIGRTDLEIKLTDQERAYRDGTTKQQIEIEDQLIQDGQGWKIGLWRSRYCPERSTPTKD